MADTFLDARLQAWIEADPACCPWPAARQAFVAWFAYAGSEIDHEALMPALAAALEAVDTPAVLRCLCRHMQFFCLAYAGDLDAAEMALAHLAADCAEPGYPPWLRVLPSRAAWRLARLRGQEAAALAATATAVEILPLGDHHLALTVHLMRFQALLEHWEFHAAADQLTRLRRFRDRLEDRGIADWEQLSASLALERGRMREVLGALDASSLRGRSVNPGLWAHLRIHALIAGNRIEEARRLLAAWSASDSEGDFSRTVLVGHLSGGQVALLAALLELTSGDEASAIVQLHRAQKEFPPGLTWVHAEIGLLRAYAAMHGGDHATIRQTVEHWDPAGERAQWQPLHAALAYLDGDRAGCRAVLADLCHRGDLRFLAHSLRFVSVWTAGDLLTLLADLEADLRPPRSHRPDATTRRRRLVHLLRHHGRLTRQELVRHLGCAPGTATSDLKHLMGAGLVRRIETSGHLRTSCFEAIDEMGGDRSAR